MSKKIENEFSLQSYKNYLIITNNIHIFRIKLKLRHPNRLFFCYIGINIVILRLV